VRILPPLYSQPAACFFQKLTSAVTTLKKAWEIEWCDLGLEEEIGRGAFGSVHAAIWRELRVAVKMVISLGNQGTQMGMDVTNPLRGEIDKEISMLQTVRHSNIVLFFGAGLTPNGLPFLVTELMERGTLTKYLTEHPSIEWTQKNMFALDTAKGMAHVHSLGRMHRDLKSSNLLISSALRVKVADFGTATIAGLAARIDPEVDTSSIPHLQQQAIRAQTMRTKGVGTPLWMAPEIMSGGRYGPSADIYSYGVVMWEIAAQAEPWAHLPSQSFFMDALLQEILANRRPPIGSDWPAPYVALLARCWATEPSVRGTFTSAVTALQTM
jgi:LRR receptor-like serine/threonine-protein kinase FLS2